MTQSRIAMATWWALFAACGTEPPVAETPGDAVVPSNPVPSAGIEAESPRPLDGGGYEVAVFSEHATRIELWRFAGPNDSVPTSVHPLQKTDTGRHIWTVELADAAPGTLYGLRAWGPNWPYDPAWVPGSDRGFVAHVDQDGNRFNPNKLLVDPRAKAVTGEPLRVQNPATGQWQYDPAILGGTDEFAFVDSAGAMPKSVLIDRSFNWQGDIAPRVAKKDTIVYEVHLRGYSKAHPEVPVALQGTYDGFASRVDELRALGVTAVELLPIHDFNAWDDPIASLGETADRRNYWGYMSLGYFAPDRDFLCTEHSTCAGAFGEEVRAFKRLVRALHAAGIEVWLDVVYNHTGEGGGGPTGPVRYHSFRGLDNQSYYTLADDRRFYWESTGTGNNLNANSPAVQRLILDSLRYWIDEMRVDGFRFDLAYTLGRVGADGRIFDPQAPLLLAIAELGRQTGVKMVAEAWDTQGYGVGAFPDGWMEWNGRWRDTMRRFTKGDGGEAPAMGAALTASHQGFPTPDTSVGYVTAHDGFTLNDLVSFNVKQNGVGPCNPTGADPNSGSDGNESWDSGGDEILRRQQIRNFAAQLLLQQGVPMILGGDERRRTQFGNNNGYMADNPCGWLDWQPSAEAEETFRWFSGLVALRKGHPALGRDRRLTGADRDGDGYPDIGWHGVEPDQPDWTPSSRSLAYLLDGSREETGAAFSGPDLYVAMNAFWQPLDFRLPTAPGGGCWDVVLDTAPWAEAAGNLFFDPAIPRFEDQRLPSVLGDRYGVNARSVVVLASRACDAPEVALVGFEVQGFSTRPGQSIRVVGDAEELGSWSPLDAPELRYAGPSAWQGTIPLDEARGQTVAFKFVVTEAGQAPIWEAGDNRTVEVPLTGSAAVTATWR